MNTAAAFADTLPARWAALSIPGAPIRSLTEQLSRAVSRWIVSSRSRQTLEGLDEHLLKDIGLTRAEAQREADKFFWQV